MTQRSIPSQQVVSYLELAALPNAVRWSRHHARDVLRAWQLSTEITENAELVISELVTNSVKYGTVHDGSLSYLELTKMRCLALTLRYMPDRLFVEVFDPDPTPPRPKVAALEDEGGRGLYLVAACTKQWSYYHPPTGGKVVWCEFAVSSSDERERVGALPPR